MLLAENQETPDIAIYDQLEFTPGRDEFPVARIPLGVIEILSTAYYLEDFLARSQIYFDSGIQSYWLIIPDLTTIYVFSAPHEFEVFVKKETLVDAKLGIELELGAIFS
jgi:Uma2 family endonuclease